MQASNESLGERFGVLDAGRGAVGSVAFHLGGLLNSLDGAVNDATGFRVGNLALELDEAWENFGDEGADGVLIIDKLGHCRNGLSGWNMRRTAKKTDCCQ